MRIPFDSLTLYAIVHELQPWVGSKVQRISQPSEFEIVFEIYGPAGIAYLLISCHPEFYRAHVITKKPGNPSAPPAFCALLRARIGSARIVQIKQRGWDRILQMELEGPEGNFTLVCELMGGASNLFFCDDRMKVQASMRRRSQANASRPNRLNTVYQPPAARPSSSDAAKSGDGDLAWSPFLRKLAEALGPNGEEVIREIVRSERFEPVLARGFGAYPISVSALGIEEHRRPTLSIALERHFDEEIPRRIAEQLQHQLLTQLERVRLARQVAIQGLDQAVEAGEGASKWQIKGELIQAFGGNLDRSLEYLDAIDYEGNEVRLKLDPELSLKEQANACFQKAKHTKSRLGAVRDQRDRLSADLSELVDLIEAVRAASTLSAVQDLSDQAKRHRWLNKPSVSNLAKEDRPFEGHRVRELLGPGGFIVLYGENAESNEYLTMRVARPNDIWLHVRGSTSAHVVIQTRNKPETIQKETLLFAAKVAVMNSTSKHAGYVPVDYTLKKHVRKPKGAPKGSALYTHEKTLHVES